MCQLKVAQKSYCELKNCNYIHTGHLLSWLGFTNYFMKNYLVLILFFVGVSCHGQSYLKPNEKIILSFQTINNKLIYLVKDAANKYICYRFGTKDKVEFEYPLVEKDSWKKFKYSYYLRGGGTSNEGMDLNYVYFTNNGYQYVIYHTYFADGDKSNVGIKVIDLKTPKTTDIKGTDKTRKGTLIDFRDNNLLEIGDELFD